jgi:hypothetical protein
MNLLAVLLVLEAVRLVLVVEEEGGPLRALREMFLNLLATISPEGELSFVSLDGLSRDEGAERESRGLLKEEEVEEYRVVTLPYWTELERDGGFVDDVRLGDDSELPDEACLLLLRRSCPSPTRLVLYLDGPRWRDTDGLVEELVPRLDWNAGFLEYRLGSNRVF